MYNRSTSSLRAAAGGPGAAGAPAAAVVEQTPLLLSEPLLCRVDGHVVVVAANRQVRLQVDREERVRRPGETRWVHVSASQPVN